MSNSNKNSLSRDMGLLGLAATGICSMLGAAINVIPFMIQRSVPGIGPYVLPAFLFAAIPAIFAALAYAILASAMPRAGGSYIYASRAINPYLGFVASFSQWFGLSIAIGVVSYVIVPFLRDVVAAIGWQATADLLNTGTVRLLLSLAFLWIFVLINLRGIQLYEKTLIPLMFVMFALGAVVIVAGLLFNQQDFAVALTARGEPVVAQAAETPFKFDLFLAAAAVLFASFIGFDSIAQAGGEAKNPAKSLPLAIGIAILTVGTFYFLFTASIYHVVPWQYIAEKAQTMDLTAPGLLGHVLPVGWTVAIVLGAAIALINDLPAMLLAVSRLMFAWAEDGIFPKGIAKIHPNWRTPHVAIIASGMMASVGILGSHLAGDFFLGVDLLVISMLVNFMMMCISVLMLPRRNPELAKQTRVISSRAGQRLIAIAGIAMLSVFLIVHIRKDLSADVAAWYFRSTPVWLLVMAMGSVIYIRELSKLKNKGVDVKGIFSKLPPE